MCRKMPPPHIYHSIFIFMYIVRTLISISPVWEIIPPPEPPIHPLHYYHHLSYHYLCYDWYDWYLRLYIPYYSYGDGYVVWAQPLLSYLCVHVCVGRYGWIWVCTYMGICGIYMGLCKKIACVRGKSKYIYIYIYLCALEAKEQ